MDLLGRIYTRLCIFLLAAVICLAFNAVKPSSSFACNSSWKLSWNKVATSALQVAIAVCLVYAALALIRFTLMINEY